MLPVPRLNDFMARSLKELSDQASQDVFILNQQDRRVPFHRPKTPLTRTVRIHSPAPGTIQVRTRPARYPTPPPPSRPGQACRLRL
ncbi:MAG: hypothetical protein NVSMB14_17550 [Isosphaeraceae bacterium]